MKAVIPAAGLGTRFLPATKSMPKEMLPLVDTPSIQFVVEECLNSGIDDIIIITGRGKRAIEDYFDHSMELELVLKQKENKKMLDLISRISDMANIHFIRQKRALGLGHAISRAEKHVGSEPFTVLLGDDIVFSKTPCTKQLVDLYNKYQNPVIAVEKVPKHMIKSYGIVDVKHVEDSLHLIKSLVEKPEPDKAPSNLGIIGRYLLTPDIFDAIKQTKPGRGGEIQLTDALHKLNEERSMYAWEFEGIRYDLGNKFDYLRASIEYALRRKDIGPKLKKYLAEICDHGVRS
ncbi:UTP--glucose-1-phosphate uridylyltransferase GalU [Candidatus Altiarchaeota archaeon]